MSIAAPLLRLSAALLVLLVMASSASASPTRYANFRATISGTYVNEGSLTGTDCFRYDDEAGERVALPPMTGAYSEHTTFRSTRSSLIGFEVTAGSRRVVAGGMPIPVRTTIERASELATPFDVKGCTPQGDQFKTRCGTKTKSYKLSLFGVAARPGLSYNFSNGFSTTSLSDPFECPMADGSGWFGSDYERGNGVAKLPIAKLLDPGARRIVLHGTVSRGSERLRWTVVLTRHVV